MERIFNLYFIIFKLYFLHVNNIQADKKVHKDFDYGWDLTTFWFGDHDKKDDDVEFPLNADRVIFS